MKSIFVLFTSLLIGGGGIVNEQLLRAFNEQFPKAQQVAWKESVDNYAVDFVEDGVRSHIVYRKDGAFISSIRYYQERTLPYYLLNVLKKRYTGKTIFSVTETSTVSGIEYFVKLEDSRVWLTVRIDSEGNPEVVEKYRK